MSFCNTVTEHEVTATVRHEHLLNGEYHTRPFYLMLGDGTNDQKVAEARRILRQIGWDAQRITVKERV